jgi:aspartate-semialdehyde dehydrogenase
LTFIYADADFLILPKGSVVHPEVLNLAREANCLVLNGSSDAQGAVILPGMNEGRWAEAVESGEISIPSSAAALMLPVLKPLQEAVGIDSVNVMASISLSDCGRQGVEELREQTIDLLSGKPVKKKLFDQRIAFNLLPQVGELQEDGSTTEEARIAEELVNGLGQQDLRVSATCMRVPVFFGDSLAVHLDLDRPVDVAAVNDLLSGIEGIDLAEPGEVSTIETVAGCDDIVVSRIRQNPELADQISFWLVADPVRCNAIQTLTVAEILLKDFLK